MRMHPVLLLTFVASVAPLAPPTSVSFRSLGSSVLFSRRFSEGEDDGDNGGPPARNGSGGGTRRGALRTLVLSSSPLLLPSLPTPPLPIPSAAAAAPPGSPALADGTVEAPLKWIPDLQAYVVFYYLGTDRFGAVLDTGSPFLTVPGYCDEKKWGCLTSGSSVPSGLPPTVERFDNNEGAVEWRSANFSFGGGARGSLRAEPVVFGVLSENLMGGSGGVFLGLVRDVNRRIRPSLLGQIGVRSFSVDLRPGRDAGNGTLALSTRPAPEAMSAAGPHVPLLRDLNRRYGDPVVHYVARASSVRANGSPVGDDGRPIYVIFDTGVTGMVVDQELFERRYAAARKNREKSLWGTVEITLPAVSAGRSLRTGGGGAGGATSTLALSAVRPIVTPLGEKPWKEFRNAHLIIAGLAFLDGRRMTVDIDDGKIGSIEADPALSVRTGGGGAGVGGATSTLALS
eukprot:CAMPEP_0194314804 /NCGR_PEP_ID=MMETSP0171-20130528/11624_1 /TAXON_ID=218684 /ORGANISM="Corethron pennatum, Strain L29A3" /LENGTH=455 /DNA_ID=CAMNT_0039070361 /DNA_START=18 /DNA_END=1383 /DNA_ORIENTATION=-